jgi:hypothetical protein
VKHMVPDQSTVRCRCSVQSVQDHRKLRARVQDLQDTTDPQAEGDTHACAQQPLASSNRDDSCKVLDQQKKNEKDELWQSLHTPSKSLPSKSTGTSRQSGDTVSCHPRPQ